MEVGFAPLKDSKLSTREFVALHLINRSSRLLSVGLSSYPNYTNAQLLLLNIWKIQVNIVVNVYWMDQWCLSLSILNNCNFFSVLKNTNFDEAFARAKDRSNYLEIECQFGVSKRGGNSFVLHFEYSVSLLFSIWLHSNLHLELEHRILCPIVSAWNRYKYISIIFFLKMIVSARNCYKYISIIF